MVPFLLSGPSNFLQQKATINLLLPHLKHTFTHFGAKQRKEERRGWCSTAMWQLGWPIHSVQFGETEQRSRPPHPLLRPFPVLAPHLPLSLLSPSFISSSRR
ncbi:hypothetical protein I3842_07G049200 [Carya illinoinensis]|uniref:Uncharacterized protein n=1 Tax=Carya illinoinensis TaxID=32201 RepID=A0A922JEA6_CARIL|nr:hypothetical protein I3842_07G049200 [Carya illinoinensis]